MIKRFNEYNNYDCISENMKYHIENDLSILENIFRPYSDSYFELIKEARTLYDNGFKVNDSDLFKETDFGKFELYNDKLVPLDLPMMESEYHGKDVDINKPMRSNGPKKYKVYVIDPKTGHVKLIHFGDKKGGLTSKVNDPKARKAFADRHQCSQKKDKTKPGYWSCNLPKFKNLVKTDFNGYW